MTDQEKEKQREALQKEAEKLTWDAKYYGAMSGKAESIHYSDGWSYLKRGYLVAPYGGLPHPEIIPVIGALALAAFTIMNPTVGGFAVAAMVAGAGGMAYASHRFGTKYDETIAKQKLAMEKLKALDEGEKPRAQANEIPVNAPIFTAPNTTKSPERG